MEPRASTSRQDTEDKFFSIVINKLPLSVNEETIKPHVILTHETGKKSIRSRRLPQPSILWKTPIEHYTAFEQNVLGIANALKNYLNNQKVAASFHNGYTDENCKFHGHHLHIVQKLPNREIHIQHHYAYKN